MINYIRESSMKNQHNKKEYSLWNRIIVIVSEKLPNNINLQLVLDNIEKTIPKKITNDIESIYIGNFEELNRKGLESLYVEGAILVTNQQDSEQSLFNTLLHEFAHGIEKAFTANVYGDGSLQKEFLNKRKNVYNILLSEGYKPDLTLFLEIDYNQELDKFLYEVVGYDKLSLLTNQIFIGPYSITSLREYFASGFEHYHSEDREYLQQLSPQLCKKIKSLTKN